MEDKRYLSIKRAAGWSSLSERFLYQLCKDKKLRYFKINRRIVIQIADLQEFINEGIVEPVDWPRKAREMLE